MASNITLTLNGRDIHNVFALHGTTENSATFALGWCLKTCPTFCSEILTSLGLDSELSTEARSVLLQNHAADGGYTDIEIIIPSALHLILEAKRGWTLPSEGQLARYAKWLDKMRNRHNLVVSVSAADDTWARRLPGAVEGYTLLHRSWHTIVGLIRSAYQKTQRSSEKAWLRELHLHLEGYMVSRDVHDNNVYVVSLSSNRIRPNNPYTWIDVVEVDKAYFHPVGTAGWPAIPPNYIGFRYQGKLQSVHHIDSFEVAPSLTEIDRRWPDIDRDHFVYRIGPAMKPSGDVKTGKLFRAARCWCAIDTLLSGAFPTISDAAEETKLRSAQQAL